MKDMVINISPHMGGHQVPVYLPNPQTKNMHVAGSESWLAPYHSRLIILLVVFIYLFIFVKLMPGRF